MNKAFLIGIMVGIICPIIGLFIVLRRMSLIADALAHISLAGVAAGLLTGTQPILAASVFSISSAVIIEKLRNKYSDYAELSIAIILSAGLALAAIFLSMGQGFNVNVLSYLFGSIVVAGKNDHYIILGAGIIVLVFVLLIYKELYFIAFDEEAARASGVAVSTINIAFTVLTSLTIAISMRIIGILLVSSLMIIPVAAALQIAKSLRGALLTSIIFSQASIVMGLFTSFYFNLSAGGSIVISSITILIGIILYKSIQVRLSKLKVKHSFAIVDQKQDRQNRDA